MGAQQRGQLARAHEQREAARRKQEFAREEIAKYYAQQRGMDAVSGSMLHDDVKRHAREAREREAEEQTLEALYTADRERELSTLRTKEEEALCSALGRQAAAREAEEREVQRLREESAELRELREKLRLARVNKERALQLAEKAELAAREAAYDAAFDEALMRGDAEGLRAQREGEAARRAAGRMGMKQIEEQMQARGGLPGERAQLQAEAEAEYQRDRAMVDAVVARIHQEDALEAAERLRKRDETRAFIADHLAKREAALAAARAAAAAEDAKIRGYWEMVAGREGREAARQRERRDAAARIYDRLRLEAEAKRRAKDEEDRLIDLMREEEAAEARRRAAAAAAERREAQRREMLAANAEMLRLKAEREARERREEEAFRAAAMARFAEDDRVEQMNALRRRLRVQEHKRAVDAMVAERRAMFEAARAAEAEEEAAKRAEEARRAAIIEGERRKLLAQAADLQGFLPRGVLRGEDDAQLLRAAAAAAAAAAASGRGGGAAAAGSGVQRR
ncbi:hypothetical protein Rsub_08391 [Raphidocelis subcapitata]|uniref:Meiosis-specific nuclear structural protein 1 n=1 Tax=Raphidocelis subcapitata TaxID=307507 RepID=A0A2V0P788_9CHLO|nr:hypothetical protein Rsub_08391 [Raphidocelis subcapitata]|eukprot:GBF95429.1 hypothetical protein Rsub_08391 [Raphidocelis subcapitata]